MPEEFAPSQSETRLDPHYLFYCYTCGESAGDENARHECANDDTAAGGLHPPYWWTVWRPRILPTLPPGLPKLRFKLRFFFRWALHRLHLFADSGSGVLLIYDRRRLVHYSCFTPEYWRFPFVADDDVQIGDTWTDPAYRGRGLALFALQTIVTTLAKPGRQLWYVVEDINPPSIRVAEKGRIHTCRRGYVGKTHGDSSWPVPT